MQALAVASEQDYSDFVRIRYEHSDGANPKAHQKYARKTAAMHFHEGKIPMQEFWG